MKALEKVYVKPGSTRYHDEKRYGFMAGKESLCGLLRLSETVSMPETSAVAADFKACGRCWMTTGRTRAADLRRHLIDRGVVA